MGDNLLCQAVLPPVGLVCHDDDVPAFGELFAALLKLLHGGKDDAIGLPADRSDADGFPRAGAFVGGSLYDFGRYMFAPTTQNNKQKSPKYWTIFCWDVCTVYGTESACYYPKPDLTCPYQKKRRQFMQTKKMKVQYSSRSRQSKSH